MNYLQIFWRLARYRVAVMLAVFMAIALAFHTPQWQWHWQYAAALIFLICGYVGATGFNDLADEEIDKVNHAGRPGRLLVSGEATRRQMLMVGVAASVLLVASGLAIGPWALLLSLIFLIIDITYSLPPFKLSYRTHLVPFVLGIGYVGVPYGLGVVLSGDGWGPKDTWLLLGLYLLFLARITLKDFRDRAGDRQFGKPTILLRYGKRATIALSAALLLAALAPLLYLFGGSPSLAAALVALAIVIWWLHTRLEAAPEGAAEQVVIGVAAKVGNGILMSILAWLLLTRQSAPLAVKAFTLAVLCLAALANLNFLRQDPQAVIDSYRG